MEAVLKFGSWFEIELNGVYKLFRMGRFGLTIGRSNKALSYFDAWRDGDTTWIRVLGREILIATNEE